ncbi:MAG: SusC/RagA family TonB-linked outer membrane protein [Bacteroidales bacterium]|nr:SusC/RagA family TonB-linked outer membrane protein [Bacteroidales bacterium]
MKKIKIFFTALMLTGVSLALHAQGINVTGKVTDASNSEPVSFASIQIKGTTKGGSSLSDGTYSINAPSDAVLIFSSIGYKSVEVNVAGSAVHDVILEPDSEFLEETIVVAFGTSTKESFTGSATVVGSEQIEKVQSSNVVRSLEGAVAGVQMTTSTGTLGSTPTIVIRGVGSVNAGSSPLYVVDGVPYQGDLNNINPTDIESVTVLKDAASNALYGARGANGVIMVSTKKAKAGEAVINLDAKWGLNTKALQDYEYIKDPGTFYETRYNSLYYYYLNGGKTPEEANLKAASQVIGSSTDGGLGYLIYDVPEGMSFIGPDGKINPYAKLGRTISYQGTDYYLTSDDWVKELYKKSLRQEYNLNVSGTTGKASFFGSIGYYNDKGIVEAADMSRLSARLRADYQAKPWLKIGMNAGYSRFKYNNGNDDEGEAGSTGNVFSYAALVPCIYPVYIRTIDGNGNISIAHDEYGNLRYDFGAGDNAGLTRPNSTNSNALQTLTLNKNNSEGNAINGTAYVDITFLKDFKFSLNAGVGLDETRIIQTNNLYYGQFATNGGTIWVEHDRQFYYNFQQLLSWNHTFKGVHNVEALIGHENYQYDTYYVGGYKTNMFSNDVTELDAAVVDGQSTGSNKTRYLNEGYFIRAQYDYDNRIFASASFRRDATSRFDKERMWGNFWSVGAGWLIDREKWFRAPWVDMLKIKASVGSQGNDQIGNYRYTDLYSISNNQGQIAVAFGSKGNKNISWETATNFNTGVEFEFFGGMLSGSVEYFYRKTSDMLFFFRVPKSLGYSGYYDNIGDMRNSGVEIALQGSLIRNRDWEFTINANLTHYKNKVLRLPDEHKTATVEGYEGFIDDNRFVAEGLPRYEWYMRKWAGVDRNTGEAMWYKDVLNSNGDVIGKETTKNYSEATRYLCGDPTPKAYGGFGFNFRWKGIDASAQFTYQIGGLAYDSGYAALMGSPSSGNVDNVHKNILEAWTPENKDSNIPRYVYLDQYYASTSTRFLTSASYLNFQNAQIGYTLPQKWTSKAHISRLRIYVTCDNIWYLSHRKGFDPRYSLTGVTNYSHNSPVRTISGGINITF